MHERRALATAWPPPTGAAGATATAGAALLAEPTSAEADAAWLPRPEASCASSSERRETGAAAALLSCCAVAPETGAVDQPPVDAGGRGLRLDSVTAVCPPLAALSFCCFCCAICRADAGLGDAGELRVLRFGLSCWALSGGCASTEPARVRFDRLCGGDTSLLFAACGGAAEDEPLRCANWGGGGGGKGAIEP